jgi:hypothetical protein
VNRFTAPLAGVARTLTRTTVGMALDVASGMARLGEATVDSVAGRARAPGVLRVQVLILSDEKGRPLSTPEAIRPALQNADRVLQQEAGVRVRVVGLRTIAEIPPPAAIDPRANKALLLDDLLGRTEFYRRHLVDPALTETSPDVVGVPLTVLVVRNIAGNTTGCSLGMSADWVITQASLFDRNDEHCYDETVLAHELGHALNLPHHPDRENLMFPESSPPQRLRGTCLAGWQRGLIQANRHVVPGHLAGRP